MLKDLFSGKTQHWEEKLNISKREQGGQRRVATSSTTSGTQHERQQDPPSAGTHIRSIGRPDVGLSPCELPKATSGETCGETAARQQGVDDNCEQQGLFIRFILPDMLSLLKANVGKSSVSLKLSLKAVTGAVNVAHAVAGGMSSCCCGQWEGHVLIVYKPPTTQCVHLNRIPCPPSSSALYLRLSPW